MLAKVLNGAQAHFDKLAEAHPENYMIKYIQAVQAGHILVGEKIKNATIRQVNELYQSQADDYPFFYDWKRADNIVRFAKMMPDVNAGVPLPLPLFKGFIFSMIDGWRIKETGGTRFKRIYLSMARTNGKTDIASVLALRDFLFGQPENSRQIIIASNSASQTKALYGYVRLRWNKITAVAPFNLLKREVTSNQLEMRWEQKNTRLWKLTAGGEGADSSHPTLAIFDEYHEQETTEFLDTITSGNVQNADARLIIISTAGTNPNVPMREEYDTYTEAIEHNRMNDRILFLCWEQDDDEECWDESTWIKSNPLLEVDEVRAHLVDGIKTELKNKATEGTLPRFLVKNMNRWQNSKTNAFISLETLRGAQQEDLPPLKDCDVYVGFDLSISNDDTSFAFVQPVGDYKFVARQFSFIPTKKAGGIEAKMKADGINYQRAQKRGFAQITRDRWGKVNMDTVWQWFEKFIEERNLNVLAVGYDAYNAGYFVKMLNSHHSDWKLFPIRQGAISLTEPTKFLQNSLADGTIVLDKNDEIMQAALTNAVMQDKNNSLLIDKNLGTAKIDCADALIDALYEGMYHYEEDITNEKQSSKDAFAGMTQDQINDFFTDYFG